MPETKSRMTTKLCADLEVTGADYEYANGELGMTVRVAYSSQPYEVYQFTLTADEAESFAGQLEAHAREMRRR